MKNVWSNELPTLMKGKLNGINVYKVIDLGKSEYPYSIPLKQDSYKELECLRNDFVILEETLSNIPLNSLNELDIKELEIHFLHANAVKRNIININFIKCKTINMKYIRGLNN